MKKFRYLIFLSVPLFVLDFCTSPAGVKDKKDIDSAKNPVSLSANKSAAVLELFTSQGCSSCPLADRLLGTYTSKKNIIVLSFHVDYWDHSGWKDPYNSKEYTRRQYEYASALHADVYTPQLIINGQSEMIGSDANKISSAINKALEEQPEATLNVKYVKDDNGQADVNFDASGKINNSILHIALVENKTTTDIKAGENGGIVLTNYNVVRNFKTITKVENGNNVASINIPSPAVLKNMSVIIFLQKKDNNKITAATQSVL